LEGYLLEWLDNQHQLTLRVFTFMALPRFQLRSLKTRITLLTLGIVVVAFLVLTTYLKGLMREELLRFSGEQQRSALGLLASDVDRGLQERLSTLKTVAVSAMAVPLDSEPAVRAFLLERPFLADVFNGGVKVWNQQGVLQADVAAAKDDGLVNALDPQDLAQVLGTGKEAIGRVQISPDRQAAALTFLAPLHNAQGEVSGALGGVIRLDRPNFLNQMTAHRYGKTGHYFLIDARQRMILTTSDTPRILEVLPAPGVNQWIDRFVQGYEGTARAVNPHGVEVLVSIQQIPLAHWYVSVTIAPDEAFALIDTIKGPTRWVGLMLLVLSMALIWWMLRRQLAPMTAALTTLDGFVRLNQAPQALPVLRDDEIGQLVGGFNRLLDTLSQQQQILQGSELFKQAVLNSVTAAIAVLDQQGAIVAVNEAWGCLASDIGIGANFFAATRDLAAGSASTNQLTAAEGIRAVLEGRLPRYYIEYPRQTPQLQRWFSMSVTAFHASSQHGAVVSVEDISQRVLMENQVRELAFYDPLTGLANRRLALERLTQKLAHTRRAQAKFGLLFIDLDHFKPVNDELGHEVGDWLLQAVAQRILGCLRESDTAARMGGDEFVVLLPDLQATEAALVVAEKIRSSLAQEFVTDQGVALGISSSIGVSIYPDHAKTDIDLLRLGDEAMYRAKKRGRNAVEMCQAVPADLPQEITHTSAQSYVHLRWKDAFNCGQPDIDRQHRKLFGLANALLDAAALRQEQPDSFDAAFLQLLSHVMEHFRFEENILEISGYADLAGHAQLHRAMLAEAQALYAAAQVDDVASFEHDKLVKFLVNDLVAGHLVHADRAFFEALTPASEPDH
jgi:diguanylate cyclase (GGDEF)-like protein/hemerythrin-like metal-binding protein